VTRKTLLAIFVLSIAFLKFASGEEGKVIHTEHLIVVFEKPLGLAAKEIIDIYPALRAELEQDVRWQLDFRPTVVLVRDRKKFEGMAGTDRIVAYAVPERKAVVIDYSRMSTQPFTLRNTLKHEMCHLLLHRYIAGGNLPKWLDEGICQRVSDGIAEIIMDTKRSVLREATLSRKYLRMEALTETFPRERKALLLAYEQSKSFVAYIEDEFGWDKIIDLLEHLKSGDEVEVAILRSFSVPMNELEMRWHGHLRRKTTWVAYLAHNIYGILFFLGALITVYGFIRAARKRRRYADEGENGQNWENHHR